MLYLGECSNSARKKLLSAFVGRMFWKGKLEPVDGWLFTGYGKPPL